MTSGIEPALEWMRTRPDCIKKLMRQFPPSCIIRIRSGTHLCEEHVEYRGKDLCVSSYFESGHLGVTVDDGSMNQFVIHPEDFDKIDGYRMYHLNGEGQLQDEEWVRSVIG